MNESLVVFVRGLISFVTLLIFARILGKQQISQLTFFDYVLGITIGSTASSLTTDLDSKAWPHWVGLITWTGAVFLTQLVSLKWRSVHKYLNGEPTVVIMNGNIMEKTMKKIRYTTDDLLEQLRLAGEFDIGKVEFAVLETNGQLSVLKKTQYQPVTPHDLKLSTNYQGIGAELIYDGVIIDQNLQQVNLDRKWLYAELKKHGIKRTSEVFLALLDSSGSLYIDTYKDHITMPSDIND
jgi:uncharacterized membrane protein YcaP (DUF421 family)